MDNSQLAAILGLLYPQVGTLLPALSKLTAAKSDQQPAAPNLPAAIDGRMRYVQGETEAATYRVPDGEKIALFDSEKDVVYIKWSDADGKQHMMTADLTFRVPEDPTAKFVTKEDFQKFREELPGQLKEALQQLFEKREA